MLQGSWKQSILPRYLKDLCLPDGWMWKVSFQHRAMIVPNDTITCWSKVTGKQEVEGLGFVALDVGMRLATGVETCPGTATLVLTAARRTCRAVSVRRARRHARGAHSRRGEHVGRWIAIGRASGWMTSTGSLPKSARPIGGASMRRPASPRCTHWTTGASSPNVTVPGASASRSGSRRKGGR